MFHPGGVYPFLTNIIGVEWVKNERPIFYISADSSNFLLKRIVYFEYDVAMIEGDVKLYPVRFYLSSDLLYPSEVLRPHIDVNFKAGGYPILISNFLKI